MIENDEVGRAKRARQRPDRSKTSEDAELDRPESYAVVTKGTQVYLL